MSQKAEKSTRLSLLLTSSTEPTLGTPIKLKTDEENAALVCSGATDISIGNIENFERESSYGTTENKWRISVPVNGPVLPILVNGAVTIGDRLVLHSSGTKYVSETVVLNGANHKYSQYIALSNNASGDATIDALQSPAYIPVT